MENQQEDRAERVRELGEVQGEEDEDRVAYTAVDYYTLTVDRSDCCKAGVEALRLQVVVYPDVNESVKK